MRWRCIGALLGFSNFGRNRSVILRTLDELRFALFRLSLGHFFYRVAIKRRSILGTGDVFKLLI
jgi:hypothetical protein